MKYVFYVLVVVILFLLFWVIYSSGKSMDSLSIEDAAKHFYNKNRHPDIVGTGCGKNEIYVYIRKTLNIDIPKTYLGFQVIVRKTGEIRSL